jgi:hypothetical protein
VLNLLRATGQHLITCRQASTAAAERQQQPQQQRQQRSEWTCRKVHISSKTAPWRLCCAHAAAGTGCCSQAAAQGGWVGRWQGACNLAISQAVSWPRYCCGQAHAPADSRSLALSLWLGPWLAALALHKVRAGACALCSLPSMRASTGPGWLATLRADNINMQ